MFRRFTILALLLSTVVGCFRFSQADDLEGKSTEKIPAEQKVVPKEAHLRIVVCRMSNLEKLAIDRRELLYPRDVAKLLEKRFRDGFVAYSKQRKLDGAKLVQSLPSQEKLFTDLVKRMKVTHRSHASLGVGAEAAYLIVEIDHDQLRKELAKAAKAVCVEFEFKLDEQVRIVESAMKRMQIGWAGNKGGASAFKDPLAKVKLSLFHNPKQIRSEHMQGVLDSCAAVGAEERTLVNHEGDKTAKVAAYGKSLGDVQPLVDHLRKKYVDRVSVIVGMPRSTRHAELRIIEQVFTGNTNTTVELLCGSRLEHATTKKYDAQRGNKTQVVGDLRNVYEMVTDRPAPNPQQFHSVPQLRKLLKDAGWKVARETGGKAKGFMEPRTTVLQLVREDSVLK